MNQRNQYLRNKLKGSEPDPLDDYLQNAEKERSVPETEPASGVSLRRLLLAALIFVFGFYLFRGVSGINLNPFMSVQQTISQLNQPSEDLLNRMNARMIEMGYTDLSHDDLRELRSNGVTATYISNVRALGFSNLTLDQAVTLAQANASSAFMAMMTELGYDLDIDDFLRLRRAGVTAHYTSNIHDLGYRDVTVDQLIRMQRIGVSTSLIERLQSERGEDVPLEDIIRFRISNQ